MIKSPAKASLLSAIVAVLLASLALFAPAANAADTPTAVASPSSLTSYQLGFNGLRVAGDNYVPNSVLTPTFDGVGLGGQVAVADAQGKLDFFFARENVAPGVHTLTFTAGSTSATASFTVTPNPVPTVTLTPSTISSADLAAIGLQVSGSAFSNFRIVATTLEGKDGGSVLSDGAGNFSRVQTFAKIAAGQHNLTFTDELGKTASAILTVTGEVPADPQVSFSPSTISTSALVSTGTNIQGQGFPANRPVEILYSGSGEVIATVQTDSQGQFSYVYKANLLPNNRLITFRTGSVYVDATLVVTADTEQKPTGSEQGSLPAKVIPASVVATKAVAEQPVANEETLAATGNNEMLFPLGLLLLAAGGAVLYAANRRTVG